MKTILVVSSTFPRSSQDSIPRFVLDLCKELSSEYRVVVLTPHISGAQMTELLEGIQVHRIKYLPERFESLIGEGGIMSRIKQNRWNMLQVPFLLISQFFAIVKYSRIYQPDILHGHWVFYPGFLLWLHSWINTTPYILTSHGSDLNVLSSKFFQFFASRSLKAAGAVTTVSPDLAHKATNLGAENVEVIPMGIQSGFFTIDRSKVHQHQIISVGRLDKRKGFQYMIQAMQYLPTEYTYQIVGEGVDRSYLENLIQSLHLEQRVTLLGSKSISQIQTLYTTAGVFVLPSETEGFGLSVVEAMASGIPVVVQDIPTLKAQVEQDRGEAIDRENLESLAESVKRASSQPQDQILRAKTHAKQYTWTAIGKRFNQLYQSLRSL